MPVTRGRATAGPRSRRRPTTTRGRDRRPTTSREGPAGRGAWGGANRRGAGNEPPARRAAVADLELGHPGPVGRAGRAPADDCAGRDGEVGRQGAERAGGDDPGGGAPRPHSWWTWKRLVVPGRPLGSPAVI